MTPEQMTLRAIDLAIKRCWADGQYDLTIQLSWRDYKDLLKLKGLPPEDAPKYRGLRAEALPIPAVRGVPIHVQSDEYATSMVRYPWERGCRGQTISHGALLTYIAKHAPVLH